MASFISRSTFGEAAAEEGSLPAWQYARTGQDSRNSATTSLRLIDAAPGALI
jgi:hypothetical protein